MASLLSSQDELSSGENLLSISPPFPPVDINGQEVQVELRVPASRAGGEVVLGPRRYGPGRARLAEGRFDRRESHVHGPGPTRPPAPLASLGVFCVASALLSSQDQLSSGESLLSISPPFHPADINGLEVQVELPTNRAGGELVLGPRPLRP